MRLALDELKDRSHQLQEFFGIDGIEEWQPNEFPEQVLDKVLATLEKTALAIADLHLSLAKGEPALWSAKVVKRSQEAAFAATVESGIEALTKLRKQGNLRRVTTCPPGVAEGAVFQKVQFTLPGERPIPPDSDDAEGERIQDSGWSEP